MYLEVFRPASGIQSRGRFGLKKCQAAKANLQGQILKQTDEARNEDSAGGNRAAFDKQIRSVINELIYLETRNGEFIAGQRAIARAEFEAMERCGRNVSRIQKSYAPAGATAWETYS